MPLDVLSILEFDFGQGILKFVLCKGLLEREREREESKDKSPQRPSA